MKIRIVDILDDRMVIAELEGYKFKAKWNGENPNLNDIFIVEMDIDDELIWNDNICFTSENSYKIIQGENEIIVYAKLDYDFDNNLASLVFSDSIVLIDIKGLQCDVSDVWVKLKCKNISLYNANI